MDKKDSKNIEDMKKLLILGLITRGVQRKDIAQVLGVDKSTITWIVPTRKIKLNKTKQMKRYDQTLVEKIATKLGKSAKYIREQISKRALKNNVLPEAELANWARLLGISANKYTRRLTSSVQAQVYSRPSSNNGSGLISKPSMLRIIRIGKKEDQWYNNWLVQLLIAFFLVGIVAGTISQVLGMYFGKLFGLLN